MFIGTAHDDGTSTAHFIMDQANRIVFLVIGPKRVRTDQFGAFVGMVGIGWSHRAHFMKDDGHASLGQLPGGFTTGQTGTNNMNRFDRTHVCELLAKNVF